MVHHKIYMRQGEHLYSPDVIIEFNETAYNNEVCFRQYLLLKQKVNIIHICSCRWERQTHVSKWVCRVYLRICNVGTLYFIPTKKLDRASGFSSKVGR